MSGVYMTDLGPVCIGFRESLTLNAAKNVRKYKYTGSVAETVLIREQRLLHDIDRVAKFKYEGVRD